MATIKSINISGIRGVRDPVLLDLNNRSILIFGENGSGKTLCANVSETLPPLEFRVY